MEASKAVQTERRKWEDILITHGDRSQPGTAVKSSFYTDTTYITFIPTSLFAQSAVFEMPSAWFILSIKLIDGMINANGFKLINIL